MEDRIEWNGNFGMEGVRMERKGRFQEWTEDSLPQFILIPN